MNPCMSAEGNTPQYSNAENKVGAKMDAQNLK